MHAGSVIAEEWEFLYDYIFVFALYFPAAIRIGFISSEDNISIF